MTHDYELAYHRLLADVRAARDKIGDTPCRSAGITAVSLLEKVLERHRPVGPETGQAKQLQEEGA